jgi:hypothetical protein
MANENGRSRRLAVTWILGELRKGVRRHLAAPGFASDLHRGFLLFSTDHGADRRPYRF